MGMSRQRLTFAALLILTVTLVTGARPPSPATAQGPIRLKMQASWPASLTIFDQFKWYAERVEKLSAGRVKIEALPAGVIVPPFEVLDATHKRVIDGGHSVAYYWIGKHRAAVLFTGGPGGTFGMDNVDYIGWMYEGGGLELYQQFYRDVLKVNVVAIPIVPTGPQAFGWFKRPIKSLADFKGMKCRQTGISSEVYTEMGMRTVNMPGGEIIPAAERGVIDCAEWVGGVDDLRLGFQNVWKYHYTPGMHEPVTVGELLINGDVWKSLGPELQEILKAAAMEAFIRWWARLERQNAQALRELREKHKVNVLRTPDEILIAFLRAWDKIAAREAERDPFFKKVLESQREYASVVVPAKRFMLPSYSFAADYYWSEKKEAAARAAEKAPKK
jgi:TRAP-type mannitol/chloroaromatic compound transport system substrate-binding protein